MDVFVSIWDSFKLRFLQSWNRTNGEDGGTVWHGHVSSVPVTD